jgi:hypothetical protein
MTNMAMQIGAATSTHWRNPIRSSVASSIRLRPMMLGGLPIG